MLTRIHSAATLGLEARVLDIEVDASGGFPRFTIVGLPDAAVREARERVRSALKNSGFAFPSGTVTVNLAPADFRKSGAALDLPVALGLAALGGDASPGRRVIVGELGLGGEVRPIRGALCLALAARDAGFPEIVLPAASAREASAVDGIRVVPVPHLSDAAGHLFGGRTVAPLARTEAESSTSPPPPDFSDLRGQLVARRAAEIAAAGGHHLLLTGPPGAGKTMLARRLPGILAPLTDGEALEVTRVHSVAGTLPAGAGLVRTPPFRAPHHGISAPGLVGGGSAAGARRDVARPPRSALSRRDRRVSPRRPGGDPTASRGTLDHRRARGRRLRLPLRRPSRRRDESLPLRFRRRSAALLRMRSARALALRPQALGPVSRPDRPARRHAGPPVAGAPRRRRRRALRRDPRPAWRPRRACAASRRPGRAGLPQRGSHCTGACAALPPRRRGRSRSRDRRRAPPPVGAGDPSGPARRAHDRRSRRRASGSSRRTCPKRCPFARRRPRRFPARSSRVDSIGSGPYDRWQLKSGASTPLQTLEPARAGVHGRGLRGSGKEETGEVQHDHFRAARAGPIPQAHDLVPVPRARRRFRRGSSFWPPSPSPGPTSRSARSDREYRFALAENARLRSTTADLHQRLDGISRRMSDFEARTRRLAIVAGLTDSARQGVGGPGLAPETAAADFGNQSSLLDTRLSLLEKQFSRRSAQIASTPTVWPVRGAVSSGFGLRSDPFTGGSASHEGIDISTSRGEPVLATADGTVLLSGLGRRIRHARSRSCTTTATSPSTATSRRRSSRRVRSSAAATGSGSSARPGAPPRRIFTTRSASTAGRSTRSSTSSKAGKRSRSSSFRPRSRLDPGRPALRNPGIRNKLPPFRC